VEPTATHIPLLAAAIARTSGPVLELGSGEYSTFLIHMMCGKDQRVVTADNDAAWMDKWASMKSDTHRFVHASDWSLLDVLPSQVGAERWGVVFVDHWPPHRRAVEIGRVREHAQLIVAHDTENSQCEYGSVLPRFSYRYDMKTNTPWTSVVSMYDALDAFVTV